MKKFISFVTGAILTGAFQTGAQSGGEFEIPWSTIDNGAAIGAQVGGEFALVGTVGQWDPGLVGSRKFTVEGGFWSGVSLEQNSSAPLLKIRLLPDGRVVLSWPRSAQGFSLEYKSDLTSGGWLMEATPIIDTLTEHTVTISPGENRCYRLKQ